MKSDTFNKIEARKNTAASFKGLVIFNLVCIQAIYASDFGDVSIKKQNCFMNIKSLPEYTSLPKIKEAELSEWVHNKNGVVLPKYDFVYVPINNVLKHIAIAYYFDSISRKGFVRVNGGIADTTDWYGSFHINDQILNCINSTQGGTK